MNSLFALFAVSDPAAIAKRLAAVKESPFPFLSHPVTDDSWFLIAPASTTTKEWSDFLGLTGTGKGTGVIVRTDYYFGSASSALWEWIAAKLGTDFSKRP